MINFVDGSSCKVIEEGLAKEFLDNWADAASGLSTLDEVLGSLRPCKESDPKYQTKTGIPLTTTASSFFTVVEYKHIRGHIADSVLAGELALAEDIYTDFIRASRAEWPDLETQLKGLGTINVRLASGKGLKRSPKNIVWVSTARPGVALEEDVCHKSSGDSEADTARENLGLVHISKRPSEPPPLLVALEINAPEVPSSPGIWRPTQLDAETHTRFRGAFGDLRKNAKDWGRTIHLHKLSDKNGELGAPESVTLSFSPGNLRLWFLGYPRLRVDDGRSKDDEFVNKIARGRLSDHAGPGSTSTIVRRFLSLCH